MRIKAYIFACVTVLVLSGCGNRDVRQTLKEVEAILNERPEEALASLDDIDSTSLGFKPLRMRHNLLYSIALDKNHIDDGRYVEEMAVVADWYEQFGDKNNKLKAKYYYGDQLRGAGRLEEASVQFMRSEKEAVEQEDWFMAGMSARSLFYMYSKTYNSPEELSCIKRAVDYFHKAGLETHEDDARIKLAGAYYDNSQLMVSDSLFNEAIFVASGKKDTVRLRRALVKSVNGLLSKELFRPDSVISRLRWAERLGYPPDSRMLANYGTAYYFVGEKEKSDSCYKAAYKVCGNRRDKVFITSLEYESKLASRDTSAALALLQSIRTYESNEIVRTLEQSVLKVQKNYLDSENARLTREVRQNRVILVLAIALSLAFVFMVYLLYTRKKSRLQIIEEQMRIERDELRLNEEKRAVEFDRYRLACEELGSLGIDSLDKISKAYDTSGANCETAVFEAYRSVIETFRGPEFQSRFLESVDRVHGKVIAKLRDQIPSLGDDRIMLFAFLSQGLSYTTIGVILRSDSKQNLYNKRQRLVDTIKEKDPPDKELFLGFLSNRSTRGDR